MLRWGGWTWSEHGGGQCADVATASHAVRRDSTAAGSRQHTRSYTRQMFAAQPVNLAPQDRRSGERAQTAAELTLQRWPLQCGVLCSEVHVSLQKMRRDTCLPEKDGAM